MQAGRSEPVGWQYEPVRGDDRAARERLRDIANERRRFGYRRLAIMLRCEGKASVEWHYIAAGEPTQNGYVVSCNGPLRGECLNKHWFVSLAAAKRIIAACQLDDNTVRLHSGLGGLSAAAYVSRPNPGQT